MGEFFITNSNTFFFSTVQRLGKEAQRTKRILRLKLKEVVTWGQKRGKSLERFLHKRRKKKNAFGWRGFWFPRLIAFAFQS